MKKNRKSSLIKGVAAIVFTALVITLAVILVGRVISQSSSLSSLVAKGTGEVVDTALNPLILQIDFQNENDEMLMAELESGYYSPEEPLVVVNPYNISPLTALVLFQTAEPAQVSIHIPGTSELTAVDFTFDGYLTDHVLPVYGLYADAENQVVLTVAYENGTVDEYTVPIETEKLDSALDALYITTELAQPEQYSPGFNLTYDGTTFKSTFAYDADGAIRLQLQLGSLFDVLNDPKLMDYNDHFLQVIRLSVTRYVFLELNPLGRIYRAVEMNYARPHHDMLSIDDGDSLLVLCDSPQGDTLEDMIIELDLTTGNIVHALDLKTILQAARNMPTVDYSETVDERVIPEGSDDPFHVNTIISIEGSDDIIISPRNQNQVIRMSWPDGQIKWIAGDPKNLSPMYQAYCLTPIGENFSYFYRQHAPEIMADLDDDPDTIDLLLFDNGTTRDAFDDSVSEEDLYSRMVHYRINEKDMTIELIRDYGKEYGLALFSSIRGDADELPNRNWLGMFDVSFSTALIHGSPAYVEINQDNELVWMLQAYKIQDSMEDPRFSDYRVERQSLYNDAANDLRLDSEPVVILKD